MYHLSFETNPHLKTHIADALVHTIAYTHTTHTHITAHYILKALLTLTVTSSTTNLVHTISVLVVVVLVLKSDQCYISHVHSTASSYLCKQETHTYVVFSKQSKI